MPDTLPGHRKRAALALGVGAVLVMGAALAHAWLRGDFLAEGRELVASPWGLATLADAYVGLALFGGWIATRERSAPRAVAWIVALALGGNLVAGVYVVIAATRCAGDSRRFWAGESDLDS